jgi:CheY-like chemotaxis protein
MIYKYKTEKKMKFLVVDDEKDVEMLFRQKFRKEIRSGHLELEFAFSGQHALEILRSQKPPEVMYIFSDINMPGMTGLELLDQVKNDFPLIKVSMISAYGDTENYEKAMSSGAKEFFTKPIDFDSLKNEVEQILKAQN